MRAKVFIDTNKDKLQKTVDTFLHSATGLNILSITRDMSFAPTLESKKQYRITVLYVKR